MTKTAKVFQLLHFIPGIAMILIFAWTGQVMDRDYAHLEGMEDFPRMAFRAGHIYILLSGIGLLLLGSYIRLSENRWIAVLQAVASIFLFAGCILFVYSFFAELPATEVERPVAREAIWMCLRAGVLHGLAGIAIFLRGS